MTIFDFLQDGGSIAFILVGMNVIGFSIMLRKWWVIYRFNRKVQDELPRQVLAKLEAHSALGEHMILEAARTEIAVLFGPLENGLTTVKNIASTAPLLGLLGTVIGIFQAFAQIAEKGLDDPTLFAGGIKLALVTTVVGLIVAIPHLIGYNYLVGMLDREQTEVENEVILHLGKNGGETSDKKDVCG